MALGCGFAALPFLAESGDGGLTKRWRNARRASRAAPPLPVEVPTRLGLEPGLAASGAPAVCAYTFLEASFPALEMAAIETHEAMRTRRLRDNLTARSQAGHHLSGCHSAVV